jgi:hypothetical protein
MPQQELSHPRRNWYQLIDWDCSVKAAVTSTSCALRDPTVGACMLNSCSVCWRTHIFMPCIMALVTDSGVLRDARSVCKVVMAVRR